MNYSSNYALSIYAVSQPFQKKLEQMLGEPIIFLLLSELRQKSPLKIWQALRKLNVKILILPIEYDTIKLLLPVMKILATFISVKQILIVDQNLSCTKYYKYHVFSSIWNLLTQFIVSHFAYRQCQREINHLLNNPIENYPRADINQILYLDATLWLGTKAGGSVGHITGVANALCNHGYNIKYAAESVLPLLSPQVEFIKISPPRFLTLPVEFNLFYFNNSMVSQLSKQISNHQFIYQRISIENYAGVQLSRILKIPLIVEYNGPLVWTAKNWGKPLHFHKLAQKCEDICLKHAHLIVTVSQVLKDRLINLGVQAEKIVFYPNCIAPDFWDPDKFTFCEKNLLRDKLNISESTLVFTFIGTFGDWHGIDILAYAIKKFVEEYLDQLEKYNIRFLLIGDGSAMPLIKSILNENKYMKYVILTGIINQDQAAAYLAISDIFLSPHVNNRDGSRFFGSPTKLFEYMAMGKPIIASNLEQIGQVLKTSLNADNLPESPSPLPDSEELAVLCEPGNINHLINAFLFLTKNPEWRKQLGKNARNEVLSKYTWHNHVAVILEKLRQVTQ
jgi:glycosyltransferase involved in cell wall biosynthesis